jgi:2-methylcitrate dehydratase PrpD
MTTTARLAHFAATLSISDIPPAVRQRALVAIIDALGTVYAGLDETSVQLVRAQALREAAAGRSSLLGLDLTASPGAAALANGAAAHALDFDNISLTVSGFVASPCLFALLALAEASQQAVSGTQVLEAFVAGWEVEAAIAAGLGVDHYARGWHSTATLGHFGAAVAGARVIGLDAERIRSALGVAASEASGLRTMIGNMTNPFHVGKAARNGVTAALLAADGFQAEPDVIEHSHGVAVAFNGKGNFDLEAMTNGLGSRWDLLDPGLVVKVYPCCGLIHSGIDATLALRPQVDIGEIEQVIVAVHALVPPTMKFPRPRTGYEAKFSTPFCIATALLEGAVRLEHFTDARTLDPAMLALMDRVTMVVHQSLTEPSTFLTQEFTEVTVRLRGDSARTLRVDRIDNLGSRGRPLDVEGIARKFHDCAGRHPRWQRLREGLTMLRELEHVEDIRIPLELLR